jgi:hypothetical protein
MLAQLHRAAWQLTRERHLGVATLADYAALGVVVHAYTAALLTVGPASVRPRRVAPPGRHLAVLSGLFREEVSFSQVRKAFERSAV